jgi:hypothetical protein
MNMFWIYVAALVGLLIGANGKLVWPAIIAAAGLAVATLAGWSATELLNRISQQL